MDGIDSKVSAAKRIAERLIKRNADVTSATSKRDVCLYKFFEVILDLDKSLRQMGNRMKCGRPLRPDTALICLPKLTQQSSR